MSFQLQGEALVERAAQIAQTRHEGQIHFFGDGSYFDMHLEPVATIVRRWGHSALFIATAYLHDVKEDTDVTDEELLDEGMPGILVESVNILAKQPGQLHEEYLRKVKIGQVSRRVKLADSSFNYSWTILNSPGISNDHFRKWTTEYAENISYLR